MDRGMNKYVSRCRGKQPAEESATSRSGMQIRSARILHMKRTNATSQCLKLKVAVCDGEYAGSERMCANVRGCPLAKNDAEHRASCDGILA